MDTDQKAQVWLIWLIAVLVTIATSDSFGMYPNGAMETSRAVSAGAGVVIEMEKSRHLFPWLPNYRWRALALAAYRRWRRLYWRFRSPGNPPPTAG